ncbi:MAG: hypothetical protein ACLR5X_04195 [Oscillospiraceae bacterium]|jgi:hypothetical protein|nr:hypothetical protein [Clostridiales bacterium]
MIRGSSWECGWCGDFGSLQRTPAKKSQNTAQITLTLSFVYHVDLPKTWSDLKKALGQLAPKNILLSQLLGKVLLHHISAGIQHAGALPDEKKAEELRTFLHNTLDLNLGENAEEVMRDAKRGVLFREEAALSETDCGTFWTELSATRPVEDYYNRVDPDGLFELFSELSSAYAYFGGKKDEEMGEAQDYQNALEEAYHTHWQNKVLLHPDVERAKRLLAQGKFPDYEDICREILLVEYPEEVSHETAEDFDELSWERVLDDVFARNPEKGMEMWRRLLDIAEPSLKTDAKTAEKLLPDWNWLEFPTDDQALPLLVALDDKRFVSQLFESASIGRLQLDVLNACRDCGQEKLGQHCLELALKNPRLEENWKKRLSRVFSTTPSSRTAKPRSYTGKPVADTKPDNGTVYHYCSVQVQGTRRPYAYLTGGLPLKVGDCVELPFGKDDVLRRGQVKAVMDCTRMVAPWPPEQTKTVIRTIETPAAVTPTIEVAASKPQKRVEQRKKSEKVEVPVIFAPETKAEEPKAEPQVTEPVASEKDEKKSTLSKKPFPLGKLIAAVLAVAVIAWVSISVSNRNKQRAAAYEAALQELSNGNYTSAEQGFSALSGYRDAASLFVYCKYADMYKDRTDYAGGQDELANITLQYDTGWQQNIDALETRVKSYKAEKDSAEEAERQRIAAENAAKREQSLKDQYSGKLPVEGMPVSCLKYTSLGEPDKRLNCKNFEKLEQNQKYFNVYWYDGNGEMIAAGMCAQWRDDSEFMLKTFSQYYPSGSNKGQTFHYGNGDNNSGSIRDDYDNPEDLWEDNQDWYEDEDEAWDEWENG